MPIAFDCECGQRWWSPPKVTCDDCGVAGTATPDPIIWTVGRVPGTTLHLSAQMRDAERFTALAASGIRHFVDVAGAAHFVWRPDRATTRAAGVTYVEITGVEDTNVDLPDSAFDRALAPLEVARVAGEPALLFCAAGLKRSPHLLYGILRAWGNDAASAWNTVLAARPFADPWPPYLDAAERWLSARGH